MLWIMATTRLSLFRKLEGIKYVELPTTSNLIDIYFVTLNKVPLIGKKCIVSIKVFIFGLLSNRFVSCVHVYCYAQPGFCKFLIRNAGMKNTYSIDMTTHKY